MKRSPFKPRTPMMRRSRILAASKTKKYRRRVRYPDFVLYVLSLPCELRSVDGAGECFGRTQADHAGPHGLGEKCPDDECIPLCMYHHECKTNLRGYFRDWTGPRIREWLNRAIHVTKGRYQTLVDLGQCDWRSGDL